MKLPGGLQRLGCYMTQVWVFHEGWNFTMQADQILLNAPSNEQAEQGICLAEDDVVISDHA